MSEENETNLTNNQNMINSDINSENDILNSDFFSPFETNQKLPEKKAKIMKLIEYLQENTTYFQTLKETENLKLLYNIILNNLIENNNNFVISQINLIKIFLELIPSSNNEIIITDFRNFFRKALPKLFDKFYLQNSKINEKLYSIFSLSITNNILLFNDYFPLIENICIEEDEDYKINILKFLFQEISQNEKIVKDDIPKNIYDIVVNASKNIDNENLKEIAENIVEILNQRQKIKDEEDKEKEENNDNDKEEEGFKIPNAPLSQQDSKLAFSSFIKKISKAVRNENMNKNKNNNINNDLNKKDNINNNIIDEKINENNNDKNKDKDNEIFNNYIEENKNVEKKIEIINEDNPQQNEDKDLNINNEIIFDEKNLISEKEDKYINDNNNINIYNNDENNEHNEPISLSQKESKEDININENLESILSLDSEAIDKKEKPKRIIAHIKRVKSNSDKKISKDDNSNKIEESKSGNKNDIMPENNEQIGDIKENKVNKKENKNKKGIKTRITRSRKLGVLAKARNNKEKEELEDKNNLENINNENNEKIIVNKTNLNSKENDINNKNDKDEDNNNIIENNEIMNQEQKNNKIDFVKEELLKNDVDINQKEYTGDKKDIQREFKLEEPKNQEQGEDKDIIEEFKEEKENENNNINNNNLIDDIDEVPIMVNKNQNQLIEEINIEDEPIQIPKKLSMDEFNKKIDSALEQEQEHQDQISKEKTENNLKEKSNKKKGKEEDDPKFIEIKNILGNEIIDLISSQKWENKKHALEQINSMINEKELEINSNDLFEYIKSKMKNFKETNFNIIREAFNIFISLLKKRNLSKENFLLLINTYYEKIADIKLKENFIELINTAIEESIIDSCSIISNLISKITKKNNPKILCEYSTFFSKLIEDNDINNLPINEIINFCKFMAGNTNPQVRTSATNLICILYKYMGENLKPMIKDIKESTLKIIEAELEKVTIIPKKEISSKNKKKLKKILKTNSINEKNLNKNGVAEPCSTTPPTNTGPVDISKKINTQIKDLSEGKWNEKKEAFENIENILSEANFKILPTGLNDIFNLIKSKLSDGNKNYVKMLISLLTKFIISLKKDFKPWTKMIALSLIPNLSDKNQAIRNECQLCFDSWVNNVGIDTLVIHFPQFLKNDNVESRIEIMKFIKKYNQNFSKILGENIYKELIDSLLLCLQDRSNNVRNEAEDIILLSLDFIDIDIYYKKIKDLKPAIEKDLKQILDNIKEKIFINNNITNEIINLNNNDNYINNNPINEIGSNNNILSKKNSERLDSPLNKAFNIKEKIRNSLKAKKSGNFDKSNNNNLSNFILNNDEKLNLNNDYMSGEEETEINTNNIKEKKKALNSSNIKRKRNIMKTAEKEKSKKPNSKYLDKNMNINSDNNGGTLASNSTVLRSHKNINNSIKKKLKINRKITLNKNNKITNNIFNLNNNNNIKIHINKSKRLEQDKKFKFSIETITKDDIIKLKEFSKIIFTEEINNKLFENDLNKEIDFFKKLKSFIDLKENLDIIFENLDIILKIISLKINNNYNPSLIKHFISFLDSLYIIIVENEYQLNETESNIIFCLLIDKLNINNNQIKDSVINLIKLYKDIVDLNNVFFSVLNYSLNKNNKVKSKVLDMALEFHIQKKINMTSKNYIALLSKYLNLNDNMTKAKCIKIFNVLQENIKDELNKEQNINNDNYEEDEENNESDNDSNNNDDKDDISNNENYKNNDEEEYDNEENNSEDNENENEIMNINENNDFNKKENNYYFNSDFKQKEDPGSNENNDNNENNLNKFYLSEDRYQNININPHRDNSDFSPEENIENDNQLNKSNNNYYYMKTDDKLEDNQNIINEQKPSYYKNTEIISKIQKIKKIKKNNALFEDKDDTEIKINKEKEKDKFILPKKIIVKQKKTKNNANKKLKVFNNKLNQNQKELQKSKMKNNNNKKTNNNKNYINNNVMNNCYDDNMDNNIDNNSNGNNSINQNESNGNSNNNNNNDDISISLYNDINKNVSKENNTFTEKDLLEIMNNLFSEDESEKMGTIIIMHEILCTKYQQNKYILIPNIDTIIKIIIQITHELFDNIDNLNNKIIPLKFAKYLATILCKITSNKELIIHISYKVLYDLCFELLNYLLINGLDKIGTNHEGNIIFKSLNSAMLRVLENCDTTSVILALLEIVKQNQNNKNLNLLCNLAMKCLIKATQNINEIINKIQLDKILLQMHLLTYNFDKLMNGKETNSQSSIMIIHFIKNFVIDVVKIKKGDIIKDYNKSISNNQFKDKYIYNWIVNTLESIGYKGNEDLEGNNLNNNELSKSTNMRSSSTNMNKNRVINTDKKKENGGFNFEGNKLFGNNSNNNILNKKSVIIVKKHANNSINNRYNFNNFNTQSGINNINITKSSILGTSNISNNNRINVQKNLNTKNSHVYNKGGIKNTKKFKFNK